MNSFLFFSIPFFTGIVALYGLLEISRRTHFLVDKPEGDALKIHTKSIPLLGGLAMLISSLMGAILFFDSPFVIQVVGIFIGLLFVFFLGFYDDYKWKHVSTIKPLLKFVFLIACTLLPSLVLWWAGVAFVVILGVTIPIVIGFLYIFLCINAVNYQDGMDGLAGGQVCISLAGFLLLALATGNALAIGISLIFLGTTVAFLMFNLPPAKVFMGDSGAYSLGFALAVLAMLFSRPHDMYSFIAPIFIIGLPIFDGVFTNIRRLVAVKSIFLGDRSHFYDKLLQKGFSTRKTLAICYGLQILFVIIGVMIYRA
ncbi:MAG: undecaprenyl/decaprenyl-phosphate alpha-N-acetylglucosaminyl 1-phosphate transferase [Candidatus Staskawiczbacteria bacterium]|nr:undecaprenyl/decaprenyl-phosphate alpha-N-acetylglucosaminyl 1-phosphate transferase [Candidatus Staskawiczbacteria bacterium]